jgi:hypothetical protein
MKKAIFLFIVVIVASFNSYATFSSGNSWASDFASVSGGSNYVTPSGYQDLAIEIDGIPMTLTTTFHLFVDVSRTGSQFVSGGIAKVAPEYNGTKIGTISTTNGPAEDYVYCTANATYVYISIWSAPGGSATAYSLIQW